MFPLLNVNINVLNFNLVLLQFLGKQLLGNIRSHGINLLFPGNQSGAGSPDWDITVHPDHS